jgi:hypothetical protein
MTEINKPSKLTKSSNLSELPVQDSNLQDALVDTINVFLDREYKKGNEYTVADIVGTLEILKLEFVNSQRYGDE